MILLTILSFIFPVLAGQTFVSVLFRVQRRSAWLISLALAFGVGFGVFSSLTLVLLLIFGPSQKALIVTEIILACGLALYHVKRKRLAVGEKPPDPEAVTAEPLSLRILPLCFYLVLAAALITSLVLTIRTPHGQLDAWAIWNLKARYIFRSGASWRDAFSTVLGYSHPDYPLLIPLSVAGSWILIGKESTTVPALLSLLFAYGTLVLLASSLATLRSKGAGYVAGLLLLGSSLFIAESSWQYADAPIAFFILAAGVLLAVYHDSGNSDARLLVLAGLVTGLAAWTKNEGILFLVAITVSLAAFGSSGRSLRVRVRQMVPFFAGAAPVILILVVFKILVAGAPNDILSSESHVQRLLMISRYSQTAKAFALDLWNFGGFGISVVILLAVYLAALGVAVETKNQPTIRVLLGALVIVLTGFFFVFILTPYDLGWHLGTALHRLLLQLWPTFLLTYFLVVRTPEKALAPKERGVTVQRDAEPVIATPADRVL